MIKINASLPVAAPLAIEPAGDPRQQDLERALAGQLGKTVRGDVLAKMTDGSYLVRVAGTAARMMLPPSTPVGSPLSLHLVALQPRPTFQVQQDAVPGGAPTVVTTEAGPALLPGPEGSPARAAPLAHAQDDAAPATLRTLTPAAVLLSKDAPGADAGLPGMAGPAPGAAAAARTAMTPGAVLLSKAPLLPASSLPAIDLASTPDHLSAGARTIASVLAAAAAAPPQTAVTAATPLLPNGPVQVQYVAQALREALGKSGLFYESHVKEWSEGKRTLAELAREPQMQRALQEPAAAGRRDPASDPATAGFINLQLSTQEQGRIAWQGQLMAGQRLEWEIERDPPDARRHGQDEGEVPWRSGMRLRFEALGEIRASILLVNGQVQLRMDTAEAGTAARLRAGVGELRAALDAAGAPLAGFAVREHDA